LQLKHLFITHTHADHIAALEPIRSRLPKVKLHSSAKNAPVDQRNRANDFIHLGSLRITNRDTPGHAEDGVTYVVGNWPEDAPSVAVVGDAIFAGSMGGAKQLADLAKQKIRDQIFSLPPDTLICPGHGPVTTVGEETARNPCFVSRWIQGEFKNRRKVCSRRAARARCTCGRKELDSQEREGIIESTSFLRKPRP